MAKEVKKNNINSQEKLELAQKIANRSKRVARSYANAENAIVYAYRSISETLNKIVFNSKFSKLFALVLAVILYLSVNAGTDKAIGVSQASTLNDIPVNVVVNSLMYEVSGIPDKVDVIVMGDMSDITLQKSQSNSSVTADLTGLSEGTYSIKLTPTNFNSRLTVNVLDTPTVTVTIKPKTTARCNISYEFINTNKMSSIYSLSDPTFNTTEVLIRASQDTIDSIAFVKALIDVTDVTDSFTKNAPVVAYDHNGNIVNCDITPSAVSATVKVTSNSKEVPIIVVPKGQLDEGMALEAIDLDYSVVTIYGPSNVLANIDAVYIPLDISTIKKDTTLSTPLDLPGGITSMSVTKVNMKVTLAPKVSKIIEGIKVQWANASGSYKYQLVNTEDAVMTVVVKGTQKNIDKITIDNIAIIIDLSNVTVGTQEIPLQILGGNDYVEVEIQDGRTAIAVIIAN